jgi:hypothetical protein
MVLYVQRIESAQGWILGVGTLLSDSGASLFCVHESPKERLKNPTNPLKCEVQRRPVVMFDALCVH